VTEDQFDKSGEFRFTEHALFEIQRRGLDIAILEKVINEPAQIIEMRPHRYVYQSIMPIGGTAEKYLIRVIIDMDRTPFEIVTAYKTSKIAKYWRVEK
jgi:hypothetical protein